MTNRIWDGSLQLTLKRSEIHPNVPWGHGPHSAVRTELVNLAFEKLYTARRLILKCTNLKLKKRLQSSLDSAGTDGLTDMKDACKHVNSNILTRSKYAWTDTATQHISFPGFSDPKNRTLTIGAVNGHIPGGLKNFLEKMQGNVSDQKSKWIKKYFKASDAIIKGFEKSKYDGVIAAMKGFNKDIDELDKMAWLFDTEEVKSFTKIKKFLSYSKLLTAFDDALRDLGKYQTAGMTSKQSAAFLALKKAVGLVPVFGTFYQQIIDWIPTLIGNFKTMHDTRSRRMLGLAGY